MKFVPFFNSSTARETTTALSPIQVSIHVLGATHTDPHVMRAATALVEKGFAFMIVNIADKVNCRNEQGIRAIHTRRVIKPSLFVHAHFKLWFLIKLAVDIIRGTIHLLQISADVYHVQIVKGLVACYIAARFQPKPFIVDNTSYYIYSLSMYRVYYCLPAFSGGASQTLSDFSNDRNAERSYISNSYKR